MPLNRPRAARTAFSIVCAIASTLLTGLSSTAFGQDNRIGTVIYIELENHNWTQPASDTSAPQQISGNPAAPYVNSLATPGNPNAAEVSYATAYHNVLATPSGNNPSIHPSEPNYIWQEAGSNFGIFNDNDPYSSAGLTPPIAPVPAILFFLAANPNVSGEHLTGLLQKAGITWTAYQEDIDMRNTDGGNANLGGTLTNKVAPKGQWTVPLVSLSGSSTTYVNAFNGSHQWNFACKHDGTLFFTDTNGGNVTDRTNQAINHYAPLQQFFKDLKTNHLARYNLVTPDQYNEMHSSLANGFVYHGVAYTGDQAAVAEGDNFLSMVIPIIMASRAYQNNGVIVLWWDESEGTNQNSFSPTIPFFVISKLAKGNAFASTKDYTHSSDLNTWQKVFGLVANTPSGFLNDAANPTLDGTTDLSDLFKPGVIPATLKKN
jgi:hypothetical protein